MDHTDSRNVLMELESLKSKQCIFKMKEENYIKDKEILEDSIKTLQEDLQEKSEIIRSLRKELDSQSSNLYRDIATKNEELDKSIMEVNDLSKKLTIALETIEYHVKRNETIKSEFEKQIKNYDRESECKSRMMTFLETGNSQKESKISNLTLELSCLKANIADTEIQREKQRKENEELRNHLEEIKLNFTEERIKREQDLQRAKNEILQLQQNGISELHLEKMNPTVAATIKALKSSKGLMDIYSELHGVIGERDYLNLEKTRLMKSKDELETILKVKDADIERLTTESKELMSVTDTLKSRLLSLVADLRASEAKKSKMEREVLLAKRKAEISEKEVTRLMQQVRVIICNGDTSENIKQEPVDVDSAMYASVQELQEVNRALRIDNDTLRRRIEESDSEQFKQRCNELQAYYDTLSVEVDHLRHENTTNKNISIIHEKQVQMLRYLLELKNPYNISAVDKALRSLEDGIKYNIEINSDTEVIEEEMTMDDKSEINTDIERIAKLENDLLELIDNKRASDQIYITSNEKMRADFISQTRISIELSEKLEDLKEKFNEERECNERYRKESDLLRAINKNLSRNSTILESQTEEIKLKLECKISELAEKRADLENYKAQLVSCRAQQNRLRHERDEFKATMEKQKEILTNISSLQSATNLKEHLSLSNMQHKAEELETVVSQLKSEIDTKNSELEKVYEELNECKLELNESISQLNESRALADAFNESIIVADKVDAECQVELLVVTEPPKEESVVVELFDPAWEVTLAEYKNTIGCLEEELQGMKATLQSSSDQLMAYAEEVLESNQKCEFYESQLNILEKAKQEVLNENIKLTEEAHDLNASLKQDLHKQQEDLLKMKVRLEEAENVERTAQSVIDKYVKECNEAKAKYKRELTLHAADSKLLESLHIEIDNLRSKEDQGDERCKELRSELTACEEKYQCQLEALRTQIVATELQLREAETRNDRLYQQMMETSTNDNQEYLNEVIEDLRAQINMGKLSDSLLSVEKEKHTNELDRLRNEIRDLHDQLSMEKDRSISSVSESDLSSRNIEAEIVLESNIVLREQKAQSDRLVLAQKTQIDDLVQLVGRLKSDISNLEAQSSTLTTVKFELEEERNRWKERCTKLIERAEQLDPEKYRVACNDRDRFEKQLCERENNLKEIQTELNNSKEEIKKSLASIEEEKNKLKKEEAIGLQLKDIARKYKNEAAKLTSEKMELIKEKEAAHFRLANIEVELKSHAEIEKTITEEKEKLVSQLEKTRSEFDTLIKALTDENEKLISKLETTESCLESQKRIMSEENILETELKSEIEILTKEKIELNSRVAILELQLEASSRKIDEINCRCELLEQVGKEKSMKLQVIESIMVRLKEENKELNAAKTEDRTALKRGLVESMEEGPDSKRTKFLSENRKEDYEQESNSDEEEKSSVSSEESEEEKHIAQRPAEANQNATTGAINLILNATQNTTPGGTKIWWNVSKSADETLDGQFQQNLEKYSVKEADGSIEDVDISIGDHDEEMSVNMEVGFDGVSASLEAEKVILDEQSIQEDVRSMDEVMEAGDQVTMEGLGYGQDSRIGHGYSHAEEVEGSYQDTEEGSEYYQEEKDRRADERIIGTMDDLHCSYEDVGEDYEDVGEDYEEVQEEYGGEAHTDDGQDGNEYFQEECDGRSYASAQCSEGRNMNEERSEGDKSGVVDESQQEEYEDEEVAEGDKSGVVDESQREEYDDEEGAEDSDSSVVIIDDSSEDNEQRPGEEEVEGAQAIGQEHEMRAPENTEPQSVVVAPPPMPDSTRILRVRRLNRRAGN